MPPIEGLDTRSRGTTARERPSKEVPASLIVLGGGPVGVELAQAWSSLGSKVTLIEGGDRILGARGALRRRAGHRVPARARRRRPPRREGRERRRDGDGVAAELDDGGRVEAAEILVAVGRRPRTGDIGLEAAGVEPGEPASSRSTTACAPADRTGSTRSATSTAAPSSPTWASTRPGWRRRTSSAGRRGQAEGLGSPHVTFTDPQVAAVGKTLEQAQEAGLTRERLTSRPTGRPAPASTGKDTGGTTRIVVDPGARDDRRRDLRRLRDRRLPPRRHLRGRRRGAARAPAPRGRAFPTRSEIWLKLLGGVRSAREAKRLRASTALKVAPGPRLGSPGTWSRSSTDPKRAEALAVGEHPGRLGHPEALPRAPRR